MAPPADKPLPPSAAILGTMTFGPTAQVKRPEAEQIIRAFVKDRAVDGKRAAIDTARMYQLGETEALIGDILHDDPALAAKVEVHTKVNPLVSKLDEEGVRAQVEASLKALRMDSVDVMYLHQPDVLRTPLLDTLKACDKLMKEGRFKAFGLSAFAAWDVVNAHYLCQLHGLTMRPTYYQGIYNAVARDLDKEVLPAVRTFGMRCVVYNPLGAGVLTGRYKDEEELKSQISGRFSPEFDFVPKNMEHPMKGYGQRAYVGRYSRAGLFEGIKTIRAATDAAGLNMADATLRWTLHHSELRPDLGDGIIFGASSLKQAEQNLQACRGGRLPDGIAAVYEEAGRVAGSLNDYFRGYDAVGGSAKKYLAMF